MQPHQQRVVEEKAELDAKRAKLDLFVYTTTFDDLPLEERRRLNRQLTAMNDYSQVLGERLAAFPG